MLLTLEYYSQLDRDIFSNRNREGGQNTDGEVPVFVSNLPKTPARQSVQGLKFCGEEECWS